MSNKIQVIQDKAGNNVFPITHEKAVRDSSGVSLEAKLSALESKTYVEAWDGSSTPVVANIPAGVVVSYNGTNYTGTLAASSSTDGKIYLVKDGTEYDRYASTINLGGTYIWSYLGTTAMSLSGYATEEELGQLDQEVNGYEKPDTVVTPSTSSGYYYSYSGTTITIVSNSGSKYSGTIVDTSTPPSNGIDLSPYIGKTIKITMDGRSSTSYRQTIIAKSDMSILANFPEKDYVADEGGSTYSIEYSIGATAKWLFWSSTTNLVSIIVKDAAYVPGLDDRVTSLESEIADIEYIEISKSAVKQWPYILLAGTGKFGTSNTYSYALIPCTPGDTFRLSAGSSYSGRYAWFTEYIKASSGATAPLVSGTDRYEVGVGQSIVAIAPATTAFLYVQATGNYIAKIEKQTTVSNEISRLNTITETIEVLDTSESNYPNIEGYIDDSQTWKGTGSYRHILIPCGSGETFRLKGTYNTRYAFLTSNATPVNDDPAPLVSGTDRSDLINGTTVTFTTPVGTKFLYLYGGSNSNASTRRESIPVVVAKVYNVPTITTLLKSFGGTNTIPTQEFMPSWEIGGIGSGGSVVQTINATNILQSIRTSTMVSAIGGGVISSVGTNTGDVVTIYCYNDNYSFISTSSVGVALPSGTAWVRISVTNANGIKANDRTVVENNCPVVKCSKLRYTPDTSNGFIFDVELPNISGEYAQPIKTVDTGRLILPYNYSREGTPSPLILWCHGTQGYGFNGTLAYTDYLKLFSKNGYAVADCSGITAYYGSDLYGHLVTDLVDSKNNPLLLACYSALIKCLATRFNIDTDRIYIASKSAGGLIATQLSYTSPFRVRAIANLAPALCMAGQSWRVTAAIPLKFWLNQYGVDTSDWDNATAEQKRQDMADAYSKIYGYDPIYEGTAINSQAAIARMMSKEYPGSAAALGELYAEDSELMAMFDSASKYVPAPMKIWHAADDSQVPYMWSQKYVDMAHRGNGVCELRTMPSNTGGHHSVDSATNAPHTNYICENGETYDVPLAFAEALDWFKKW